MTEVTIQLTDSQVHTVRQYAPSRDADSIYIYDQVLRLVYDALPPPPMPEPEFIGACVWADMGDGDIGVIAVRVPSTSDAKWAIYDPKSYTFLGTTRWGSLENPRGMAGDDREQLA